MTNDQTKVKGEEISLKELLLIFGNAFHYLVSKWVPILALSVLGGILGYMYASIKKPIYTATTTFVLEDEKQGSGSLGALAGLASVAGVDLGGNGGGIFQGDNILELYKSRSMIEKTLLSPLGPGSEDLLIDRYILINNLRERWAKQNWAKTVQFSRKSTATVPTRLRDSLISEFVNEINRNSLSVAKPDKKLNIIKVEVRSKDELFAKVFNDWMVRNVNDFYLRTKSKKSLRNVQILQQKTDSVRSIMNGAIYSAAAVTDATPNLNPTHQRQRVGPVQSAQFSAETNKAVLAEMVKNLELSKMALLKETPLIQIIDSPVYPLAEKVYSKLIYSIIGLILSCFLCMLFFIFKLFIKSTLNK